MSSYTSSLVVEGLDASQRTTTTLTLRGGGLPKMGAAWGVEVVMPTTWYPGNPDDATQQVLVAKEIASEWAGEWNLTRLNRAPCAYSGPGGNVPQVVSPGFLVDVLEDLARRGTLLRVTWHVDSDDPAIARTVTRIGRLQKFSAAYTRSTDVEWSATFSWKSRGGTQARVVSTRDENVAGMSASLVSMQTALNDLATLSALQSVDPTIPFSASNFTLGQLESLVNYPLALVKSLTNSIGRIVNQLAAVAAIAAEAATIPFAIADAAVGLALSVVQQANQFQDEFTRQSAEQLTLSDEVADLATAAAYFGRIDDQAGTTSAAAMDATLQLRSPRSNNAGRGAQSTQSTSAANPGTLVGVRITRQGDTPQSISMLYYGTVDHDVDILRANGLPWHQAVFTESTILVIPVVTTNKGP